VAPPADPTPTRPPDAYVGDYANEYFGRFEIVADDAGLAVVQGPPA